MLSPALVVRQSLRPRWRGWSESWNGSVRRTRS